MSNYQCISAKDKSAFSLMREIDRGGAANGCMTHSTKPLTGCCDILAFCLAAGCDVILAEHHNVWWIHSVQRGKSKHVPILAMVKIFSYPGKFLAGCFMRQKLWLTNLVWGETDLVPSLRVIAKTKPISKK